jgi:hypothetical protein
MPGGECFYVDDFAYQLETAWVVFCRQELVRVRCKLNNQSQDRFFSGDGYGLVGGIQRCVFWYGVKRMADRSGFYLDGMTEAASESSC